MKIAVFSTKSYDRRFLEEANQGEHELRYLDAKLDLDTLFLASGYEGICAFVNDQLDGAVLTGLKELGVRLIALRCAGYNNIDLNAAAELGLTVVRVPAYSPHAVAEHTVALILSSNRKIHRAYNRVREGNFSLDGLIGFDLNGRTVGVIGTGRIGEITARILNGFGCKILAYDLYPNADLVGMLEYVDLKTLVESSDIITLHCPLTPETHHIIDTSTIGRMKTGVMLVNTSRGALINARAVIAGLKSGKIGSVALDVYEEEADVFFEDLSEQVLHDDVLARLLTFPNVLITSHQAFLTTDALQSIASTTLTNIAGFADGSIPPENQLVPA